MAVDVASTFTWLAYSDREQQRAQDLASLLSERETRDELGIGSIRDAIADRLFPGTSTIQSRARYFLFIPWIFQALERDSRGRARERAERAERELITSLKAAGDTVGLVGAQTHKVMRLPSSIYWAGLNILGIRRVDGPLSVYYRWLDDPNRHTRVVRDDDGDVISGTRATWWDRVPTPPADFPDVASFALTADEATYLRDRAAAATPFPTMLTFLFESGQPDTEATFPWEHPQLSSMPASVRDDLEVAEGFSLVAHGAALLYNLLIAEACDDSARIDEYRLKLDEWQRGSVDRAADFNLNRVWQLTPKASGQARDFIQSWQAIARGVHGDLSSDRAARELVRAREVRVKSTLRSRIANPFRVAWGGSSGSARMDFRWSVTVQQMSLDVAKGRAGA